EAEPESGGGGEREGEGAPERREPGLGKPAGPRDEPQEQESRDPAAAERDRVQFQRLRDLAEERDRREVDREKRAKGRRNRLLDQLLRAHGPDERSDHRGHDEEAERREVILEHCRRKRADDETDE